jgi:hypothetical protein
MQVQFTVNILQGIHKSIIFVCAKKQNVYFFHVKWGMQVQFTVNILQGIHKSIIFVCAKNKTCMQYSKGLKGVNNTMRRQSLMK